MTIFFGFAMADSMFNDGVIIRQTLTLHQVEELIPHVVSCCNPSHTATIDAMRQRFNLTVAIPEKPPMVKLEAGDSLIVMGVRGLPRLTDRHEYTAEEIAAATFAFTRYSV